MDIRPFFSCLALKARLVKRAAFLRCTIRLFLFVALTAGGIGFPATGSAASFKKPAYELVAPGVAYAKVEDKHHSLVYHVVKSDLTTRHEKYELSVKVMKAQGKETLGQMVNRLLSQKTPVLAAINGDYFDRQSDNGCPWGAHISDGEVGFSPAGRAVFMMDSKRRPLIAVPVMKNRVQFGSNAVFPVVAVNRERKDNDQGFYLYSSTWGMVIPRVRGGFSVEVQCDQPLRLNQVIKGKVARINMARNDMPVPEQNLVLTCGSKHAQLVRQLKLGVPVSLKLELAGALRDTVEAVGGGPRIVQKGKAAFGFEQEAFPTSMANYLRRRHPRSVIAYNKNRTVLMLVIVEGRTADSGGLDINDLARLLIGLGAWDAMAFDGGGSATLYVGGQLVVREGGGGGDASQRRIGNALGLLYKRKSAP